ncbi:MAG TPA: DUF308 domain-containing protein [Ktedonobacteraceae bacterium]|nr:DUF308 domain-containing protein [Ktedonobacteraceae bacterium]
MSSFNPGYLSSEVKSRAGWGMFLGFLIAGLGLVLLAYPLVTATLTTLFFGCILVVVGVAEVVAALRAHTAGTVFVRLLLGVAFCLGGLFLLFSPLAGLAVLTVGLGAMLLVEAVLTSVLAFQMRPSVGWGWLLFDAVVSLVLGVLILAHWPQSSIWAIGTLVGVAVLIRGITRIALSITLRTVAAAVESDEGPRSRAA